MNQHPGRSPSPQQQPTPLPPHVPAPDMPASRRGLPKTRTGCRTCKRRKIKCDEHKPSCLNCVKHGVTCPFVQAVQRRLPSPLPLRHGGPDGPGENVGVGATSEASSASASVSASASASDPLSFAISASVSTSAAAVAAVATTSPSPAQTSINLLDLEILHNFCTFTYTTLADDSALRSFWKFAAVRLGVNCDYVMGAILAVSALHMAHHQTVRRAQLVQKAIDHHQAASRAAMELMGDAQKSEHLENLWIFSVLTIYFALGVPRREDSSLFIGEPVLPDWLFLIRGVRDLHHGLCNPEYQGPLTILLSHGRERWQASHVPEHIGSPLLRELQDRLNKTVADRDLLVIYNAAIDELRVQLSFCLSSDTKNLDLMDAFVWQVTLADTFLPLLKNPNQEAAVIFAYFCVLLKRFESYWWLKGWGVVLMGRVWDILDSEHRPWVQWAIEEIGWIPPI